MGIWAWLGRLGAALTRLWRRVWQGRGAGINELARRLNVPESMLTELTPVYQSHQIPKRSGGKRLLHVPEPALKAMQRRILKLLLRRLRCHPAARGFQPGESIVTHAQVHAGQAVIVRLDLRNFFPATGWRRVYAYFRKLGWNRRATLLLTRLCTHDGGLPQGAPTSPRLSNLLNYRLDARLSGMAARLGARYSRYADDITLSLAQDDRDKVRYLIRFVKRVARAEGYQVHSRKLRVLRQHQQQRVTGLVVNAGVRLPRQTRRWLRSVEHHVRTGRVATLTPEQLAGWQAFRAMVERQAQPTATATALSGSWVLVAMQQDGQSVPVQVPAEGNGFTEWVFEPGGLRVVQGGAQRRAACVVGPAADPPRITITAAEGDTAGVAVKGIFRLDGDKLTVCVAAPGDDHPTALVADPGSGRTVYHLRALAARA